MRHIRVYATPYAYTPNGAPLYIEYGGEHAQRAATAVRSRRTTARGKRARSEGDDIEGVPRKKSRLVWTDALHASFVRAVHTLGIDAAVPKQIMRLMGVHSLTRENVASHLQKYRAAVRRAARAPRAAPLALVLNRPSDPMSSMPLPPPPHSAPPSIPSCSGALERGPSPSAIMAPLALISPHTGGTRLPSIDWGMPGARLAPLGRH